MSHAQRRRNCMQHRRNVGRAKQRRKPQPSELVTDDRIILTLLAASSAVGKESKSTKPRDERHLVEKILRARQLLGGTKPKTSVGAAHAELHCSRVRRVVVDIGLVGLYGLAAAINDPSRCREPPR